MRKNEKRTQSVKRRTEKAPQTITDKKYTEKAITQDTAARKELETITEEADRKSSLHNRDISNKEIFDNPVLCAQFLRDNFDIPILKHVQPEDIEDISVRFHPYLGTEFESDSVKKIRIFGIGGREAEGKEREPDFLVSLIDHKSLVDYDAAMQLLRYMMCIWTAYKKEMETMHAGITRRKEFRYPVIIPIVYFEGEAKWTAARNFRERISRESQFRKWIPDFRYELVNVCAYSNEELLSREDEMSLIMLINKIQNDVDLEQFLRLPGDRLNRILKNSPEHVVDVMVSVMESLCFKIDVSAEERMACVQKVRNGKWDISGKIWKNSAYRKNAGRRRSSAKRQKLNVKKQRPNEKKQRPNEKKQRPNEKKKRPRKKRSKNNSNYWKQSAKRTGK